MRGRAWLLVLLMVSLAWGAALGPSPLSPAVAGGGPLEAPAARDGTNGTNGTNGSLFDLDLDGVEDRNDTCRGTLPGAAVNATGCSAAQPDADGDGVPDVDDAWVFDSSRGAAPTAGVNATNWSSFPHRRFAADANSATLADLNRDGWPDLITRASDGVRDLHVRWNDAGRFAAEIDVTLDLASTVASTLHAVDVHGDGWLDIVAERSVGSVRVPSELVFWPWNASGAAPDWTSIPLPEVDGMVDFLDLNRDGIADLCAVVDGELVLWMGPLDTDPAPIAAGEVNGVHCQVLGRDVSGEVVVLTHGFVASDVTWLAANGSVLGVASVGEGNALLDGSGMGMQVPTWTQDGRPAFQLRWGTTHHQLVAPNRTLVSTPENLGTTSGSAGQTLMIDTDADGSPEAVVGGAGLAVRHHEMHGRWLESWVRDGGECCYSPLVGDLDRDGSEDLLVLAHRVGIEVWYGLAADADADGVPDGADDCAATPPGRSVDPHGCGAAARDADRDGVPDADDRCPGTEHDETANATGCGPTQPDRDGDGWLDHLDPNPFDPRVGPAPLRGWDLSGPAPRVSGVHQTRGVGGLDWLDGPVVRSAGHVNGLQWAPITAANVTVFEQPLPYDLSDGVLVDTTGDGVPELWDGSAAAMIDPDGEGWVALPGLAGLALPDLDGDGDLELLTRDWITGDLAIQPMEHGWYARRPANETVAPTSAHLVAMGGAVGDASLLVSVDGQTMWHAHHDGLDWSWRDVTALLVPTNDTVYGVHLGDVDGDGRVELVVQSYAFGTVPGDFEGYGWHLTHVDLDHATGPSTVLSTQVNRETLRFPVLGFVDLDADGDDDVLDWIGVLETTAAGRVRRTLSLSTEGLGGGLVTAHDVDRDGGLDLIIETSDTVLLFLHPGDDPDEDGVLDDACPGTSFVQREAVDAEGCGPAERDLDGDGVLDGDDARPHDPGITAVAGTEAGRWSRQPAWRLGDDRVDAQAWFSAANGTQYLALASQGSVRVHPVSAAGPGPHLWQSARVAGVTDLVWARLDGNASPDLLVASYGSAPRAFFSTGEDWGGARVDASTPADGRAIGVASVTRCDLNRDGYDEFAYATLHEGVSSIAAWAPQPLTSGVTDSTGWWYRGHAVVCEATGEGGGILWHLDLDGRVWRRDAIMPEFGTPEPIIATAGARHRMAVATIAGSDEAVVAGGADGVIMWSGSGAEVVTSQAIWSLAVGDADGDGTDEVAVGFEAGGAGIYERVDGDWTLVWRSADLDRDALDLAFVDATGDGLLDLAVAWRTGGLSLYANTDDGAGAGLRGAEATATTSSGLPAPGTPAALMALFVAALAGLRRRHER